MAIGPGGKTIITGTFSVEFWDVETGRRFTPEVPVRGGNQVSVSPDGRTLAVWTNTGVRFFDLDMVLPKDKL
jgi:hypothetical protein